jgi:hypothetical protein
MPLHLAQLNGKTTEGALTLSLRSRIILKDSNNDFFDLESPKVLVSFLIERIKNSQIKITDHDHTASFQIPRPILNQKGSNLFIPASQSGQPYDLEITETSKILKNWNIYREDENPIYTLSCNPGANGSNFCTQNLTGFDYDYYLDTLGEVEHFISIRILKPSQDQVPGAMETQSEAEISLSSGKTEQTLYSKTISSQEYYAHRRDLTSRKPVKLLK